MSEENAGSNIELSNEPLSTEIGSGEVESSVVEESGLAQEVNTEAVEELADVVEEAIEEGASDEEIQELVETFKIKVNGQEKEVILDWNDKEDIIRRLQMAEAGQGAMQRSAEMERNFERSLQDLIANPWDTLAELGLDPDELAEQRIQDTIYHLQKSPEQIVQEERDIELEHLRQQLKEEQSEKEAIEFQRLQQVAEIDFDHQITEALSATTELPKSPYVVKRVADAMLSAMQSGRDDVTASDVIPWVEKQINEEMQQLFSAMPDKALEKYIGKQNINRLRKNRLSKMKSQTAGNIKESGKQIPIEVKPKQNIRLNDWMKHNVSIKDFD